MEPEDLRWQVWWLYLGAWWSQKSKLLKNHWFYCYFLKGQSGHGSESPPPKWWLWSHFGDGNFALYKMLAKIGFRKCASCLGEEHIFIKQMKKWCANIKNGVKIMSDTSKCHQHTVAYMKMSSKWCRIHGSSRPRKPPVQIIHIFARIFEVQLGGHGAHKRATERTTAR